MMQAQPSADDDRLLRSIPPARVALIDRIAAAARDDARNGAGNGTRSRAGNGARSGAGNGVPSGARNGASTDARTGRRPSARTAPPTGGRANARTGGSTGARARDNLRQRFLHAYFRGVGEEDLATRTPAALAHAALKHLEFGSRARMPGSASVSVFNPDLQRDGFESPHTVVMIVTDDMPFLVNSVGLVFSRAQLSVHLIVHPVLEILRDGHGRLTDLGANGTRPAAPESWQLYEVDRQTDPVHLRKLQADIETTLADVRGVVTDWKPMRERALALIASLETDPPALPADEVGEARHLLSWMEDRHFVFLGYRHYRLERGAAEDRVVPDVRSGLGILRNGRRDAKGSAVTKLRGDVRARARDRELLVITKANSIATVHRGEYLDYVGVKTFDSRGRVDGEHRFLGLWTSSAYYLSPRDIPVLRRKVEKVIEYFDLDPQGHDGKAVLSVLETYPRDELFQAGIDDLIRIARGVVNLYERRSVRVLARRDPYHRFYSCLIYVPRDRYNTEVRQRIEQIVLESFAGTGVESHVQISGSIHARVHVVVRTDPDSRSKIDLAAIEQRISQATTTWTDRLHDALVDLKGEAEGLALAGRYRRVFPLAYEEDVGPKNALEDIADLEALRVQPLALRLNLHRPAQQVSTRMHLKVAKLGDPVPISDLLPMLENFGLRVISERPYELTWPEGGSAWIQDFELEHRERAQIDIGAVEVAFREALAATWSGEVENDGFNRLLLAAGLLVRQIVVLRAYCRYLLQTGAPFSQAYMERTLSANPVIARNLFKLFEARFDPGTVRPDTARTGSAAERNADKLVAQIRSALDEVVSLDEDRILRAYLNVVDATLRTNFYQIEGPGSGDSAAPGAGAAASVAARAGAGAGMAKPKPYLSFKLDPSRIPDLPLPRPKFEIFVYSPRVEAVHLRMGYVARGGIRWSDRREDFRTEVLGLMKAQNVKNTLIVPVGAKGGFVVKRLPTGPREEIQAEVIACYQTFIRGLLDLTDNIVAGKIVAPPRVIRRDEDDAYLVVAADKGTATFSDIANAISGDYRYWLGDAFASGGSEGYDHKKMGITARGAWECVKRHFRELDRDIQTADFTVAGIGDMSGDVFGNGMLLSRHTQLVAAFDHRHIFIDPSPDAAASFLERQRLFALPRSSWDDYERKVISKGGGVFARTAKSIPLSAQARALLGLDAAAAPPNDIIRAILRMPVDLLWNGGIGTYVKARTESNADVGDRANDAVRINGGEVRARVIGEGGNLGLTQRGRIEYGLSGGRLNTDFIDNSAGVNTSDVEVNIKILLNPLVSAGKLTRGERNRLLARMTKEVAGLVLRNNYLQSQAISTLELQGKARFTEYQNLIHVLERSGELNRALEFLPADEEVAERRKRGAGLTRPELSVLLSYSKIWLNNHLLASDVPEDPYLSSELTRYFPTPLQKRFARAIKQHRLRREIIATATTNSLVNRMGPTFVPRAQEETGAEPAQISRAYTAAREIFDMRAIWAQIEKLDTRVPAKVQYAMAFQTSRLLRHVTYWLVLHRKTDLQVDTAVAEFRKGVRELESGIPHVLTGGERERFERTRKQHLEAGVPADLATRVASLESHNAALDIVELAGTHDAAVLETARIYFDLGTRIGLDWLREQVEQLPVDGPWQAIARSGLRDSALRIHRRLTEKVLTGKAAGDEQARVSAWLAAEGEDLAHWQRMLTGMRGAGASDFATLSVGIDSMRKLAD